jgi:hypothetical protein
MPNGHPASHGIQTVVKHGYYINAWDGIQRAAIGFGTPSSAALSFLNRLTRKIDREDPLNRASGHIPLAVGIGS